MMSEETDGAAAEHGPAVESEASQLAEILDKCLSAVMVHRYGRVLYANQAYTKLHGYSSPAEAMARHTVGVSDMHPDDQAMIAELVAARLRGEDAPSQYEFRIIRPDGAIIWMDCLASRIMWNGQAAVLSITHDVTARKSAEEALRRSERLFSTVFMHSPDIMILSTLEEGRLLDVNEAFLRAHGLRPEEVIGRTGLELGLWSTPETRRAIVDQLRRSERVVDVPGQVRLPSGEMRELSTSAELLRVNGEELILYVSRDITERQRAEARIAHLAQHDALTGLANRAHFVERLNAALALARRQGGKLAVFALDLDRFKVVNDTLGHPAGDALLCDVAKRLAGQLRTEDLAGRLGGDEFAVLQVGLHQPAGSARLASRLLGALSAPFELQGGKAQCGTSVGIALFPDDGATAEQLMRSADIALYQAKCGGRSSFRFFDPVMEETLRERRELERDLHEAVREGAFELHYQPLFGVPAREVYGFEALLRWRHHRRGLVPPATFIPIAEETGLIHTLGTWVLHEACREAASWPSPLKVCVNLSPVQFRRGDLVGAVVEALDASGLSAERLQLEITENVLLERSESVLQILHALKAKGVGLAMDDFGTGYSSLGSIWQFPLDTIKIDQSFVHSMAVDGRAGTIIETILTLGRTLDVSVTAEGVETEQQMKALLALGCERVQGFLLGRPVPACELSAFIGRGRCGSSEAAVNDDQFQYLSAD